MSESEQRASRSDCHGVGLQARRVSASSVDPQLRNPARIPSSTATNIALQRIGGSVPGSAGMAPIAANSSGAAKILGMDVHEHTNVSPSAITPRLNGHRHLIVTGHGIVSMGSSVRDSSHGKVVDSHLGSAGEVLSSSYAVNVDMGQPSISRIQSNSPHGASALKSRSNIDRGSNSPEHTGLTMHLISTRHSQVLILMIALQLDISSLKVIDMWVSGTPAAMPRGVRSLEQHVLSFLQIGRAHV